MLICTIGDISSVYDLRKHGLFAITMHAQETAQSADNFRLHAAFVCMRHSSACKQPPACKQPQPIFFTTQVLYNMRLHAAFVCMQPSLACSIRLHEANATCFVPKFWLERGTWNLTWNLEPKTWNLEPRTLNLELGRWNLELGSWISDKFQVPGSRFFPTFESKFQALTRTWRHGSGEGGKP